MSRAIGVRFSQDEHEKLELVCGLKQVSRNRLMREVVVAYLEQELATVKANAKIRRTKPQKRNPQVA